MKSLYFRDKNDAVSLTEKLEIKGWRSGAQDFDVTPDGACTPFLVQHIVKLKLDLCWIWKLTCWNIQLIFLLVIAVVGIDSLMHVFNLSLSYFTYNAEIFNLGFMEQWHVRISPCQTRYITGGTFRNFEILEFLVTIISFFVKYSLFYFFAIDTKAEWNFQKCKVLTWKCRTRLLGRNPS